MAWEVIVNKKQKINIVNILEKIKNDIFKRECEVNIISPLSGNISSSLFYYYYNNISLNNNFDVIKKIIKDNLLFIKNEKQDFNLIHGLAGFGWLFSFFINEGLLNSNDSLKELDIFFINVMDICISERNIDLFYGILGIFVYLFSRVKDSDFCKKILEKYFFKALNVNSFIQSDNNIDYSLSHGQSGLLFLLCKLYKISYSKEIIKEEIIKLVKYFKLDKKKYEHPDCIEKGTEFYSPLRWCHGNLGISWSLLHASEILECSMLESYSLSIAKKTLNLIDEEKELLKQGVICHGKIGVSHFYNRFYQKTKDNDFKNGAIFWIEEFLKNRNNINLPKNNGILEGTQGIGLGLLSFIVKKVPKWDSIILLS